MIHEKEHNVRAGESIFDRGRHKGRREMSGPDRLIGATRAVLLPAVREELADAVRQLYAGLVTRTLIAAEPRSIGEVLKVLEHNRRSLPYR